MPEWSHLKEPNPYYPSCTSALTIKYDPAFGRHVVANRDIEVRASWVQHSGPENKKVHPGRKNS